MAESQAKEAHEKLEDQLTCAICLDTFKDPKQLQCFHVYCKDCLQRLVVTDKQGQVSLLCPTCRQVTPLPPVTRDPIDMLPSRSNSINIGDISSNNSSMTEHVLRGSQPLKLSMYKRCDSVLPFTESMECNANAISSMLSPYPTNFDHPLCKEYAHKMSDPTHVVISLPAKEALKPVAQCQTQPVKESCFRVFDKDFQVPALERNENGSIIAQDEFPSTKKSRPTCIYMPPHCSETRLKGAKMTDQMQIEMPLPNSKVVPHHQSQSQQEIAPVAPPHREYFEESQSKPEKELDIIFTSTQMQDGVSSLLSFRQPGDSEPMPVDPFLYQSMRLTDSMVPGKNHSLPISNESQNPIVHMQNVSTSEGESKPLCFPDKPCDEPAVEFSADKANQTQATQLQTKGTKSKHHQSQPVAPFASKERKARKAEKQAELISSTLKRRRKTDVRKTVTGGPHVLSSQQLMGVDSDSTSALSTIPLTPEDLQKTGSIDSLKYRSSSNSSNLTVSMRDPMDGDSIPMVFKNILCEKRRGKELVVLLSLFRPDGSVIQEETDHGYHTEICFSTDASLPKLLKRKGKESVFCLPKRSAQWRSFTLEDTFATTRSGGTSQSREDSLPLPLAPGPPETEPPEIDYEEITKLLRIPDYYSIIQLIGMRSQRLSPKSAISAHFITGVAYFKLSKYDKATEEFQKSQTLAKSMKRDGDVMLCGAYLGDIQYASQEYLKAADHYKTAIKHYDLTSVAFYFKLTPPTLSAIHAKRASSFRNVSKMVEAVQDYRTAINVARTDRDRLSAHTSLGNLYQSMGENSKALEEYKESIKLATSLSDHVSLGWAHGNIGNAYLGLNRKDEALFNLHKSLDLATKYERTPQAIGRTYNNLGTAYQSTNDLDKAEEYYDLALSQAIFGNDTAGQARVYGNIGNVHMLRKNYERAIPHYGEVLQLSKDPATVSTARHNRGCAYYEWATSLLGKVPMPVHYHGPKCDVDACLSRLPMRAKELYHKASEDLEEVVKYHEEKFQHIKGSAQGLTLSVSLFESNSRTFHRLQDCLVNLHKYDRALEVAEKSRARTLGELMLKRTRKDLKQPLNSPLNFEQIASIVKSQRNPLVYLSYTGARLIGWVFTLCSGEVSMNVFEIPIADDQFDGKSFDYYLRYTLTEKLVERSFEMYRTILYDEVSSSPVQMLFELLAAPIQKFLSSNGSNQQVIFISDSYTSLVPLACLHDKTSGSFFGDKHCFKLAPSLLTLGIMNQLPEVTVTLPPDQQDVCVIGDPNIPPFTLNGDVWTLGKLPHARREAEWVAFALQTTPILNENATLTSFLTRSMSAKVIHVATHGSASFGFLAFATFATAAKSGSRVFVPAENVLLYPDKVEQLHISPALVVLSSCDSARGMVKADGIQGMARAFILAGAQSVLTTLWKVPDESASVFMQFFYQYLLDGLKSSVALQKATLSVRCYAKYSQYIHWSGYQLTGRDIHFSPATTEVANILRSRLGTPSMFPRLQNMKMLETVLVKNTALPTDVQIVQGSPGIKPSEVVIDFITSFHQHFSAGVFWINYHLLKMSIECIEQAIGSEISALRVNEAQKALFVFDGMTSLPDSEALLRLLKSYYVHVIVLFNNSDSVDKLIKEVDRKLIRGCTIRKVEPLSLIHSTQRIVHSFMKENDFTPSNDDQQVIEKVAEFTAGSPVIVDITSQVVQSCFSDQEEPIQALAESLSLRNTPSVSEKIYAIPRTRSVSQIMSKAEDKVPLYTWTTNVEYDSWNSILTLVDACGLSVEERLLLNCLSIFSSSPIPFSMVTELASIIAKSAQKPHLAGTLHCNLIKYKLVCIYPHPVVLHPMVLQTSCHQKLGSDFVYVPQFLSQCIWKSLDDSDRVVAYTLSYHTLLALYQNANIRKGFTGQFSSALCSLLLESVESSYELVGKECYQAVYSLFLKFQIN